MGSFDIAVLDHVAALARLRLSDIEKEKFARQLSEVLSLFDQLDSIEATEAEAAFHPIKISAKLREDKPERWAWDPLANSRHNEGKYIK
ncbi:MAG: Asp-tRNA(Asn)/Glu-tRNA(Gln) amidotransferase subunit GatC, partial [Candidatus Micrarchaeaceae archaeon]